MHDPVQAATPPRPWIVPGLAVLGAAWWLTEVWYWSNFPPRAEYRDRGSNPLIVVSVFLNLAIGLGSRGRRPPAPMVVPAAGLAAAALGVALRLASVAQLGRFYTSRVAVHEDHELVDRGVFGVIRHPAYTGALLMGFGFAAALGNWRAALVFAGTHVPAILYRVRVEEQALAARLGGEYREYVRHTRALIPFLY